MTAHFKSVPRDDFWEFVKSYPRQLTPDKCGISEPPLVSWSDFEKATGAGAIVAKYHEAPYSDRIYWISEHLI
jgi:hypothetical protein